MYFLDPIIPSENTGVGYLAPIPIYQKIFDDDSLHEVIYEKGKLVLSSDQKRMGQELPDQYDAERQSIMNQVETRDMWVEDTERPPIGSRFFVPPNDFLDLDIPEVKLLRERIVQEFDYFLDILQLNRNKPAEITESWMQYYNPYEGRGHNQHSHGRWHPSEEPELGFSGGYYLSDGDPIKDHPYSGMFTFHIRGYSYYIRPKRGMLMMWPNDIVHSVKPFYGKTHRCVINFNIQK